MDNAVRLVLQSRLPLRARIDLARSGLRVRHAHKRHETTPRTLPGRHLLNLAIILVSVSFGVWFSLVGNDHGDGVGLLPLLVMTALALVLGFHLVAAIGRGDMPVAVSMLNRYSGWAAAAAGFLLGNDGDAQPGVSPSRGHHRAGPVIGRTRCGTLWL